MKTSTNAALPVPPPTAGSAADWHAIAADTTRQAITAALNGHAGVYTRLMEIAAHASEMEIKTTPQVYRRCRGMGRVPSMTDTPKTDAAARHIDGFADQWVPRYVSEEIERERDEATERIAHAEILLGELAGGYWRTTLKDQDPTGEGIMGERVAQYWAQYSKDEP